MAPTRTRQIDPVGEALVSLRRALVRLGLGGLKPAAGFGETSREADEKVRLGGLLKRDELVAKSFSVSLEVVGLLLPALRVTPLPDGLVVLDLVLY
jgi:hypothetical protein